MQSPDKVLAVLWETRREMFFSPSNIFLHARQLPRHPAHRHQELIEARFLSLSEMRIILKCNRSVRIVDMLETLKFMSINQRIEYNVCLLIFKMINGPCPSYLRDKLNLVQYEGASTARRGDKVYIEKCRTSKQQRMPLHNGFKMYNDLPCEVRRERNLKCFGRLYNVLRGGSM